MAAHLSKIQFSPQRRRGRGEESFYLAERHRQIKRLLSFQDNIPSRCRSHQEILILTQKTPLRVGRGEVSDPTLRFAGSDQKRIFLCDLRASAVNLL